MNDALEEIAEDICGSCGKQMTLIMGSGYHCDNGVCDNFDPERIPALEADEQMDKNIRIFAGIEDEINIMDRRMRAELEHITEFFGGKIESLRKQGEFWASPIERCLLSRIANDPKAKRSHESPMGIAKLSKKGGGIEIDTTLFSAEDHLDEPFIKKTVKYSVRKKVLQACMIETGETFEGVSEVPVSHNFKITIRDNAESQ